MKESRAGGRGERLLEKEMLVPSAVALSRWVGWF